MAFTRIDIEQAKDLIENQGARVVDVRDRASFDAGHIENADHISNDNVNDFIKTSDHNTPLIVCCYHGNMSQGAADFFNKQGFTQTYSLDGGYKLWAEQS